MKKLLMLGAIALVAACNAKEAPPTDNIAGNDTAMSDTNMADANMAAPAALASFNETSWEFTDPKSGKAMLESVDATGNYIANAGAEHADHGTAVMKNGKVCFDSAMDKAGEMCWTDPMLAVGQSGETTSDKGEKLTVKRVAYQPLTMPKG